MSRFSVWLLCCAVVLIMLAVERPDVNIRSLLSVFVFLGAPLLLHWGLSSEKSTEDVKDV